MNANQESKLTMYRATEKHCDDNPAIVGSIAAFQTSLANFKLKIAAIISTEQLVSAPIAGVSVDKYVSKQALRDLTADIASLIYAFASVTGNNTLREQVNFRSSTLAKERDDQLSPICQNIHDLGVANLDNLKDYGLTSAAITTLQTAINTFSSATPRPRTAQTERKIQRASFVDTFRETDNILKQQMDRMVIAFKPANPDFVKAYFSNRAIIDPASIATKIVGLVTGAADEKPIKDAAVTATGTSGQATGTVKTTTTTRLGNYTLKPLPPGDYTIKFEAPGFQTFTETQFQAKLGTNNHLDAAMEAN